MSYKPSCCVPAALERFHYSVFILSRTGFVFIFGTDWS